ncbi:MAG: hypothetical protein ACRDT0_09995, partial [Pseudonocardiaceae bacterium]
EDSRLRTALVDAAKTAGVEVEAKVAGPANIGNYLAGLGIPATAGFGVDYHGLHGTDERARLDTIPTVQAVYHNAVLVSQNMIRFTCCPRVCPVQERSADHQRGKGLPILRH